MTMLERAARAAAVEVGKIRRTRIPAFPGSWKTREGLGYDNLDEVSTAVARAVLMAVRDHGLSEAMCDAYGDAIEAIDPVRVPQEYHIEPAGFAAMIDAILNEEPSNG